MNFNQPPNVNDLVEYQIIPNNTTPPNYNNIIEKYNKLEPIKSNTIYRLVSGQGKDSVLKQEVYVSKYGEFNSIILKHEFKNS